MQVLLSGLVAALVLLILALGGYLDQQDRLREQAEAATPANEAGVVVTLVFIAGVVSLALWSAFRRV